MKFSRYIIIAAGIVVILAAVGWILRDSLIRKLSNPLLQDYGISIVDVSLDALATSDATISYLELVHQKGTTIAIEDLTLPFAATSTRSKTFHAAKVSVITSTRTDGEPFELATLIRQILSLPATLEDSVVVIDEFEFSPYPAMQDIRWEIAGNRQQLDGRVDSVSFSTIAAPRELAIHDITFSVPAMPVGGGGNVLFAVLTDDATRLVLSGNGAMDLPAWQAIARLAGIVPPLLDIESGTANLTFDSTIPNDPANTPTMDARLAPTSTFGIRYQGNDNIASVLLLSADALELTATFPNVDWSLGLAEASLSISYGDWQDVPLAVSDLTCGAGPSCSMNTHVSFDNAILPVGTVAEAEFSATENLRFLDTGLRIEVQPGATLKINNLTSDAGEIGRVQAQLMSAADLELVDAGWRLSADSVDAEVEALSLGETSSLSIPLFLEKIAVADIDDAFTIQSGFFAPSSQASWGDKRLALPGIKGNAALQGDSATADLETVGLQQEASVAVRHDLGSGTGRISVVDATVSFENKSLSDRVSPWPDDRDIVAGTLALTMSADWVRKNSQLEISGQASAIAEDVAGYVGDTAFSGVSTELRTNYQETAGFVTEPSTITAALIEVGVPVENLSADIALDLDTLSVDINDLRMSAFGGIVTAEPFSFHTYRAVNTLTLDAESLDLTELLSLQGFEAVDVTGSINVRLPLAVEGNTVQIVNGTLTGNPPGGVIRYRSDSPPDTWETSSWDFVKRVLNNLEFETLTSDVNLSKEGDLTLQLQLKGRNPELDEDRPVVLNLGVENNIPQMLRSLRAARAVEDILEKRLSK